MPTSTIQREYTPKGYVDLDLEWYSSDKEWEEGPVPTMYTAHNLISLKTNEQSNYPGSNEPTLLGFVKNQQRKLMVMFD